MKKVSGMTRWTALHGWVGFRTAGSSCLKTKGLRGASWGLRGGAKCMLSPTKGYGRCR